MTHPGGFLISLDFELYWGLRDSFSLKRCKRNLLGVQKAIPAILNIFKKYDIHATWAVVGFLLFKDRQELLKNLPELKPQYQNNKFSTYSIIDFLDLVEREQQICFAPSLIEIIKETPHQKIASHTFSHYYCLEEGQNKEMFEADLIASLNTAKNIGETIESIVFPKNQVNPEYLKICDDLGIIAYRGTPSQWIYKPSPSNFGYKMKKILRYIDSFINITGDNTFSIEDIKNNRPYNIPASRFLRPSSRRIKVLNSLFLGRILNSLKIAAKERKFFHLWWHPHNFGVDLEDNLLFLEKILSFFDRLREDYGIESINMEELVKKYFNVDKA